MSRPKVLICYDYVSAQSSNYIHSVLVIRLMLIRMGYKPVMLLEDSSNNSIDALTITDYEFLVTFANTTGMTWSASNKAWDGTLGIPSFVLGTNGSNSLKFNTSFGAGPRTASVDNYKLDYGNISFWMNCRGHTLTGSLSTTPLVAVNSRDGTGVTAWIMHGASNNVYAEACAFSSGAYTLFPLLLHEAVERGDVSAVPNKLALYHDMDDMPAANTTVADITNLYNLMTTYGCPMTWGITDNAGAGRSAITTYLASIQSDSLVRLIDHDGDYFMDGTKSTTNTNYTTTIAALQAEGLDVPTDSHGYRFNNSNRCDEAAMQLGQPLQSLLSDAANTTPKYGYGWRIIRTDVGNTTANNIGEPGKMRGFNKRRGMALLGSGTQMVISDTNITMDGSENTKFAWSFAIFMVTGALKDHVYYGHMQNYYDGHDGGNAPGLVLTESMFQMANALNNVCELKHPADVITPNNPRIGNAFPAITGAAV